MAMPTDFWRNDQQLNIFRTKPCQRLARDGVCGWRSQCQFSHYLDWPRRQPRRYNYSPELCPNVTIIEGADGGVERMENNCTAGLRCPYAHSKEEVLFHPHMFKTMLCEEHTNNSGNSPQRQTRNAKKNRCHRYYCPFAHGSEELRTSPLSAEQREKYLRGMEAFPSDVCCVVCTRHWLTPGVGEAATKFPQAPGLTLLESPDPMLWARNPKESTMGSPWDVLATVPNIMNAPGNKDVFAMNKDRMVRDPTKMLPSPIQKPQEDPFPAGYKSMLDPFAGAPFQPELRVHQLTSDSPAFIDFAFSPAGLPPKAPATPKETQPDKTVGDYYYAML